MKLIVQNVNAENFVQYAKLGGVTEDRIVSKYVIRNALLPQITGLALSLGQIFSGALITEIVFGYPGLGMLLYRRHHQWRLQPDHGDHHLFYRWYHNGDPDRRPDISLV